MSSTPAGGLCEVPKALVDKPPELSALRETANRLFPIIKKWWKVDDSFTLDLRHIDAAQGCLFDEAGIGALALRKVQALKTLCEPGLEVSLDPLTNLISDVRWVIYLMADEGYKTANSDVAIFEEIWIELTRTLDCLESLATSIPEDHLIFLR